MYNMNTYLLVTMCIIIIITGFGLARDGDVIEGLELSPDTSDNIHATQKPLFLTANKINYNLIDTNIDILERQFTEIKSVYNNLSFSVNVKTGGNIPSIRIGGNFPSNIILNTILTPPERGDRGEKGGDGDKGIVGKKGVIGAYGIVGSNTIC